MAQNSEVTVVKVVAKEHDCSLVIALALGPLVEHMGAGTEVRCTCGIVATRAGGPTTGYFWDFTKEETD